MSNDSEVYGPGARDLQDRFDSRRLADRLAELTLHETLSDDDIELIGAQSTVWLSTVGADGWPDVSYKGGDPGFVRVVDPTELRLPSYDGNGMFHSLGNIMETGRVALLFVDTARPWRLRVQGTAVVSTEPDDLAHHVGAQAVVIITITHAFPNCGRYIHQDEISPFVPREGTEPPVPDWKRIPPLQEVLPASDPAGQAPTNEPDQRA